MGLPKVYEVVTFQALSEQLRCKEIGVVGWRRLLLKLGEAPFQAGSLGAAIPAGAFLRAKQSTTVAINFVNWQALSRIVRLPATL